GQPLQAVLRDQLLQLVHHEGVGRLVWGLAAPNLRDLLVVADPAPLLGERRPVDLLADLAAQLLAGLDDRTAPVHDRSERVEDKGPDLAADPLTAHACCSPFRALLQERSGDMVPFAPGDTA